MSSFRVTYYAFAGRAEPLRLAAAIGGIAFEDEYITQTQQAKDKAEGKRRWSGPPEIVIYDEDGKEITKIGQSNACLRYVGELSGLYPPNPAVRALVDEVLDSTEDLFGVVLKVIKADNEDDKKTQCAEACKEGGTLRYWLDKFALRLAENEKRGNKNGFFVGDTVTIADLKFTNCLSWAMTVVIGADKEKGVLSEEKYKSLLNNIEAVGSNDKVKAFRQQFAKNTAAFNKDNKVAVFKYAGKTINGSTSGGAQEEAKYAEEPVKVEMEYRTLGGTGLKVSALAFGFWATHGTKSDTDDAAKILQIIRKAGINFFDNAEAYGKERGDAEKVMGAAIKQLQAQDPKLWRRSDIVITTKLFWGSGKGQNEDGLSRKHILEGINASLKRLQLDYVDVLYCHRNDALTGTEEIVRAMTQVINDGKALYWGTSEWTAQAITEAYWIAKVENLIPPVVEQPQYNLFCRENVEKNYLRLFESPYKIGTTIWSPLKSGILTGKYNKEIPQGSRLATKGRYEFLRKAFNAEKAHQIPIVEKLMQFAKEKLDTTVTILAIAWCVKNKNVSTVLLGATKEYQIRENLKALAVAKKLTADMMKEIDEIVGNKPKLPGHWGRVIDNKTNPL